MARAIVVDEKDNVIGYKERSEWTGADIIRTTGIWITNTKGQILLAQRSFNKKHDPGKWGVAAAGTVEEGETYDSNILKEVHEEIGLVITKASPGPKRLMQGAYRRVFIQTYSIVVDKPLDQFKIEKKEVEALRWLTVDELKRQWESHPEEFTKTFSFFVDSYIRHES